MPTTIKGLIFGLLLSNFCFAQSSYFDQTFGNNGIVATPNTMEISQSAILSNNTIISTGWYKYALATYKGAIANYQQNGDLTLDFANGGLLKDTVTAYKNSYPSIVKSQWDDKFITAGFMYYDHVLIGSVYQSIDSAFICRYNNNGTPDISFGNNGIGKYSFGEFTTSFSNVIVLPDLSYLAGATSGNNSVIVKIKNNGDIDTSWANNGLINLPNQDIVLVGITRLNNGSFFCYGYQYKGLNTSVETCGNLAVRKYNADGSIDTSFADNGTFLIAQDSPVEDLQYCQKMEFLSDNSILLMCRQYSSNFIIKLNANGTIDNSFGENGKLLHQHPFVDVTTNFQGQIIFGGNYEMNNFNYGYCITRLNSDGSIDNNFNDNGKLYIDLSDKNDYLHHLLKYNGKLLISGMSKIEDGNSKFTLVRLTEESLEIDNKTTVNSVSIYPNPSNGRITINSTNEKIVTVEIINTSGIIVKKHNCNSNTTSIQTDNKTGIYLCRISTTNQIITKKLIIE